MKQITIATGSLVILCGPSGCGKSTFARKFFSPTQIVSSDQCRALLSDDEANQAVSPQAFELFYTIIGGRLKLGRTTAADSTALTPSYRTKLRDLAHIAGREAVVLAFELDEQTCLERNAGRKRQVDSKVIAAQFERYRTSSSNLEREGMDAVYRLNEADMNEVELVFGPKSSTQGGGSFDFFSDIHGCTDELEQLLTKLGYLSAGPLNYQHPDGRIAVFLGDLTDRGPRSLDAFRLVNNMVKAGNARYTPGNHCDKLARYLKGNKVKVSYGLETTIAELDNLSPGQLARFREIVTTLVSNSQPYLMLDKNRLIGCHAGIKEQMIGRYDKDVVAMCLYGDTTGETAPDGLPVRRDWAAEYHGSQFIVYGHTPVDDAHIRNNTINIDTGCAFGGKLTAFRWPEREAVAVNAQRTYYER